MATLTKAELIKQVAETTGESKAATERVINAMQDSIVRAVTEEKEVRLTGFASFVPGIRSERTIMNPHTKEEMHLPEQKTVKIKPLTHFREAVSGRKTLD